MRIRVFCLAAMLSCVACAAREHHVRSGARDFLYPKGAEAAQAADVRLRLPVTVGLAFAPPSKERGEAFTELQKTRLLERIAASFRGRNGIRDVVVVPTTYLRPGGGFENVRQLASGFGLDLLALVSYDQFQFTESGRSSWTYWTIVGAYVVKGERNETRTVLDTVVYDIPSRAMLFHASGRSEGEIRATPAGVDRAVRLAREEGFERATDDLIAGLDRALDAFAAQARTGTVRGAGTPAVTMLDEDGKPVGGGGAAGLELLLAGLVVLAARLSARRD